MKIFTTIIIKIHKGLKMKLGFQNFMISGTKLFGIDESVGALQASRFSNIVYKDSKTKNKF